MENIVIGARLVEKNVIHDYYGYLILSDHYYHLSRHKDTMELFIVREDHVRSFRKESFVLEYKNKIE